MVNKPFADSDILSVLVDYLDTVYDQTLWTEHVKIHGSEGDAFMFGCRDKRFALSAVYDKLHLVLSFVFF